MSGHPPSASQQKNLSEESQRFWLQWVKAAFPDLDSRAYFLPPVHFNRVPMIRKSIAGHNVLVLHKALGQAGESTPEHACKSTGTQNVQLTPGKTGQLNQPTMTEDHHTDAQPKAGPNVPDVKSSPKKAGKVKGLAGIMRKLVTPSKTETFIQDSDVRDDAASQRILCCLQKMSEINGEVLVGLSQLQFGQYLGEPCYAAAAAQLPVPANLPSGLSENWKEGDFDVLLIHRHYGLVVCEVKAFGDNVKKLKMPQRDIDNYIRKKLTDAMSQLDKAEAMLSHLVSDVTPGLRITKTIAVPNLTARQVQQAISGDTLLTQLSDPKTPWDVTSDVLQELGNWWQRRVAVSGRDSHMTCDVYKTLVARFCGPATAVTVPCTSLPRLCVKTLGQAVSWTGECYTAQITLFPEQVDLLNAAPPRLFVAGPPGTGKSVVLLLIATEWMRCGNNVYIVSTWWASRAACSMLYYLLLQTVINQMTSVVSPGRPYLLQFDFKQENDREKAFNDLSQAGKRGLLHVIADEIVQSDDFQNFCDKLLTQVPDLHLWAASCYHRYLRDDWQVKYLTRPLRFPPTVVREVNQDVAISIRREVHAYSERGLPDHTDGPTVKRLNHLLGESSRWPRDCVQCGREVASFLHSLRDPGNTTGDSTTPPCLQWRDMLLLHWFNDVSNQSGVVEGLREADVPVRVMEDDDTEDVARARSDVVWVAHGDRVRGLERKVVVCLDDVDVYLDAARLLYMSRCTSQLVIVSPDH